LVSAHGSNRKDVMEFVNVCAFKGISKLRRIARSFTAHYADNSCLCGEYLFLERTQKQNMDVTPWMDVLGLLGSCYRGSTTHSRSRAYESAFLANHSRPNIEMTVNVFSIDSSMALRENSPLQDGQSSPRARRTPPCEIFCRWLNGVSSRATRKEEEVRVTRLDLGCKRQ
jgi:hypothetical protein